MCEAKKIVEELRTKKSRDNRELLDRAADEIERLRDSLRLAVAIATVPKGDGGVKKYGGYVEVTDVLDLPSALTNEEKVSEKEKQIEEMVDDIDTYIESVDVKYWYSDELDEGLAEHLYNAGYRKQSEGEWKIAVSPVEATFICSKCGYFYIEADPQAKTEYKYCPHCGSKMKVKGGE